MKRSLGILTLGSLVLGLALAPEVFSQEKKPAPAAAGQKAKADASTPDKNRLPSNYGKLSLTDEQRTKLYEVQDQYEPELSDLQARLAEIRKKRDAELQKLLTPEQRTRLEELRAAA